MNKEFKSPRDKDVPPVGIPTNVPLPTGEPPVIVNIKPPANINQPQSQ